MTIADAQDWGRLLRRAANGAAPDGGELERMAVEASRAHRDEASFLWWRHGVMGQNGSETSSGIQRRLWDACSDPAIDVDEALLLSAGGNRGAGDPDERALLPQGLFRTIEVWTETELSCLHALSRLALLRDRPEWLDRALDAAAGHVEHLQPDNATNRPWAIHLFVLLSLRRRWADAHIYAEMQLHNCMVQSARAEPLSALILLDAAEAMEQLS